MIQTVQSERRHCWPYNGTFRKNDRLPGMVKSGRKKQCKILHMIPMPKTPKRLVPFLKLHQPTTGMATAMLKDLRLYKSRCKHMRHRSQHSMNMEMQFPHMGRSWQPGALRKEAGGLP